MSVRVLVDMNLSPDWVPLLKANGWVAVHWSTVGNPTAPDQTIMQWARNHGYVVLTHDLDFGTALALTHATGPSVIQVRTQDTLPEKLGTVVMTVLRHYGTDLADGALIVVDRGKHRVRVLPL